MTPPRGAVIFCLHVGDHSTIRKWHATTHHPSRFLPSCFKSHRREEEQRLDRPPELMRAVSARVSGGDGGRAATAEASPSPPRYFRHHSCWSCPFDPEVRRAIQTSVLRWWVKKPKPATAEVFRRGVLVFSGELSEFRQRVLRLSGRYSSYTHLATHISLSSGVVLDHHP